MESACSERNLEQQHIKILAYEKLKITSAHTENELRDHNSCSMFLPYVVTFNLE